VFLNPEEGRRITHFPVNSRSKQTLLQVGVNKHQHTFVNHAVPLLKVLRICSITLSYRFIKDNEDVYSPTLPDIMAAGRCLSFVYAFSMHNTQV